MKSLIGLRALAGRELIELRRYSFDTVTQFLTLYVIFALVFFGARSAVRGVPSSADALPSIVAGFLVWGLVMAAYSRMSFVLIEEAATGTLEHLAMSPLGLSRILFLRFIASIAIELAVFVVFLFVMMATTGKWLHLDPGVILLLGLIIIGVQGVGYMVGGLALVFKRVQAVLQLLQFGFAALVAVPLAATPWLRYLPVAWGNDLVRASMVDGQSLAEIGWRPIASVAVHAVLWLTAGWLVFQQCERAARARGLLGHY